MLRMEEYALSTGLRSSDAAPKDAQSILNKDEYVSSTEQNASDAA